MHHLHTKQSCAPSPYSHSNYVRIVPLNFRPDFYTFVHAQRDCAGDNRKADLNQMFTNDSVQALLSCNIQRRNCTVRLTSIW